MESVNLIHIKHGSDSVSMVINYQDGDGDLGLAQEDTTGKYGKRSYYYSNLYIYYLVFDGASYTPWVPTNGGLSNLDTAIYDYRIPPLNNSSKAQPISGNVTVGLTIDNDTLNKKIEFRIFMFDRALHMSNIVETAPLKR